MKLARFAIRNPLITNLLLAVVLVTGVMSWYAMPQEMLPVVELDKVRITTVYEGAAPGEVERQVTLPLEEAFEGMADIDVISSTSSEGMSVIVIEFKPGADIDDFLLDARTVVDRLDDLPPEAERPEINRLRTRFPVLSVALYGEVAQAGLLDLAQEVKRRLLAVPGMASVGVAGERDWEIWVEVDPELLAVRRVTLGEVAAALRDHLTELPGGSIEARDGDILLRGMGVAPEPRAIEALPLRSDEAGGILALGAVARVYLRLEEPRTLARFNGRPSINMTVTKTAQASTIEVSDRVRALVTELNRELPPGVQAAVFSDLSKYVRIRLQTVQSSGLVGLVLVLLSLYLFLNFRVALITALGIPVSFLFAIIMLHYFGYTINMVSLFAFLIVLGMVVDDAIIVTENIYRHLEQGLPRSEAAERGVQEVFWPVTASTATTIAAFLPMFAMGGTMGAFIAVIPVVVIFALLGSLLEAFGVLPSHAYEWLRVGRSRQGWSWAPLLEHYARFMRWVLPNRYLVTLVIVGVLALSVAYAATRMPFELFGQLETGQFFVNVEAPNTYSLEDSARLATRVEDALREVVREEELESVLTNVGVTFVDFTTIKFESNYIQLIVDLKPRLPQGFIERWVTPVVSLRFDRQGSRARDTAEIIRLLRQRLEVLPGIQRFSILRPQGGPAGADLEVGVAGDDVEVLRRLAGHIVDYLRRLPGVFDVRQDLEPGKLEYRYLLNDRGRSLGLSQAQLAEAVRAGFQGLEATQVTAGNRRLPVRVIYPDSLRHDPAALARLRIVLPEGRVVRLGEVADITLARGYDLIKRRHGQRLALVTAEVDSEVITPLEVSRLVANEFAARIEERPGYQLFFLGEKRKANESIQDMLYALVVAVALIYFILAALFKSLLDPLVVMFAIPFGVIGVIAGHLLLDYHLQFLSLVGFLALAGIVVNDSLILVDFARRLRAEGRDRYTAMVEAGRVRARPILLTSITTFLGISPLIFFATGQTAFLAPMAVSLGFGLLFATVLILVGIPCFYLVADDLRNLVRSRRAGAAHV